ncbi:twin-arginine translocase TatA/TatE family subunit [Pseudomonas sp. JQ170]|uniref:twin-arginine translocase TatA/TatE family subunit n=1 Tax=Pseudomonas TaxID=286 RepID=UPI000408C944|nr:sec-independent protein translocase protein TatA [Pseudomonas sp. JUb96]MDN7141286.1 twin-arginine translocase TatA/TatE family subunit [Pseudomonas sp. JQ170]PRA53801.1 twin-arginine translocase TatA/TatE family subunit [Pseudomonas sp. MYb187]
MGVFDWKHWAVLLVVVLLVFGSKRLKTLGADLGESIKGFRRSVNSDEEATPPVAVERQPRQD